MSQDTVTLQAVSSADTQQLGEGHAGGRRSMRALGLGTPPCGPGKQAREGPHLREGPSQERRLSVTSLMLGDVKERNTAQPKTRSAKLKIMSPPNTVTQPNRVNWKQVTFSTYQTGDQRNRFHYLRFQAKAFLEEPQQPRVAPRRGNSEVSSMRSTEFFK